MMADGDLSGCWRMLYAAAAECRPALFLDRDGTLIDYHPYLNDADKVRLVPGVVPMLMRFRKAGFRIVIVTNQSGVARGHCSPAQYAAVQARVAALLGADLLDAAYACPCYAGGKGEFAHDHGWRKPRPGMMLAASRDLNIDLAASVMVGDSLSDVQAGAAAGIERLAHVLTGHGAAERGAVEGWFAQPARTGRLVLAASLADIAP